MWWYLWYLLQSSFDGAPCAPGRFCEIAADVARQGRPSGGNIVAVVLRLQQLVTTAHLFDILFFIFFETALPFLRGFTHPCSSDRLGQLDSLFAPASHAIPRSAMLLAESEISWQLPMNKQALLSGQQRTCPIAFLHFTPSHGATPPDYNNEQS